MSSTRDSTSIEEEEDAFVERHKVSHLPAKEKSVGVKVVRSREALIATSIKRCKLKEASSPEAQVQGQREREKIDQRIKSSEVES